MSLQSLADSALLLQGLSPEGMEFLESVATEMEFPVGAVIFNEDDPADTFYLVADGKVGLEVSLHSQPPMLVQTLGPGELLGMSWLFPPHRWTWRARSHAFTRVIAFKSAPVRQQLERDPDLAVHVYRAVAMETVRRLHSTRIRLLDLYPGAEG